MTPVHRVFVYGTLKRGGPWWRQLLAGREDVEFVGEDVVAGCTLAPAFPGCHWVPKAFAKVGSIVRGEVFAVSDERLAKLDQLERMYARVIVTTQGGHCAFMYAARADEPRPEQTYEEFPFPKERR